MLFTRAHPHIVFIKANVFELFLLLLITKVQPLLPAPYLVLVRLQYWLAAGMDRS
jgi:hypothetical protein